MVDNLKNNHDPKLINGGEFRVIPGIRRKIPEDFQPATQILPMVTGILRTVTRISPTAPEQRQIIPLQKTAAPRIF